MHTFGILWIIHSIRWAHAMFIPGGASVASCDIIVHLTEGVELVESTRSDGLLVLGV